LVVHRNLARVESLHGNQDFAALGTVIEGLERLSSMELKASDPATGTIALTALLDELRVLIEPGYSEVGMQVRWNVPPDLPTVWGDRLGLLQAFLNLARNSQRAMETSEHKVLSVTATTGRSVAVRFADTGPGVGDPELLFRPFQRTPGGTGLGLYVSRGILRSFGGDLAYEPGAAGGCSFVVTLVPTGTETGAANE
jgi:signal transduction histidine kinase